MNEVRGLPIPELSLRDRLAVLPRLRRDTLALFTRVSERYGPIARVRIGRERLVVISEPALVHELLVRKAAEVEKDQITKRLKAVVGDGLLTSEGEKWRARRRLVAPSFQRKDLESYAATMVRLAARSSEELVDGADFDVHRHMMALTVDIVVACLFGSASAMPTDAIGSAVDLFMDRFVDELRTVRRLFPERLLELGRRPYRDAVTTLDRTLMTLIAERRARGGSGDDLLARLLAARDDQGGALDDEGLRDELITLFLAGHETTALALSYTIWLLGSHPDALERARAEVATVVGDRDATAGDVARLPYLRAVVDEAMRLYPPAWAIGRTVLHDMTLGPWQLLEGDEAVVFQWILHRSGRFWDAPLQFRPERWANELDKRLPKGLYLPFGGGPRTCVGNHFAMMEAILVLATLLRTWRFEAAGPLPPLLPAVTLRPKGAVPVRACRAVDDRAIAGQESSALLRAVR